MVVFIAGGNANSPMEVYSPGGGCSIPLGFVPLSQYLPILGFINGKLTYCGNYFENRYKKCLLYFFLFLFLQEIISEIFLLIAALFILIY
jgi:hypothetical protein